MSEYVCILAGGGGTRLWPLSRDSRPKQLLALASRRTLIQDTVDRLLPVVPPERVLVITERSHAEELRAQVPEIPSDNFIVEPQRRGTATALTLAAFVIEAREPGSVMSSVHADSLILDAQEFARTLSTALEVAGSCECVVVLGIVPTEPTTQLGYIWRGEHLDEVRGYAVHRVRRFVEKPDRATAESYLASGEYYWNPGVFAWRTGTLLRRVSELLPDLHRELATASAAFGKADEAEVWRRAYAAVPSQAIEYGVVERTHEVLVIPARFRWSDIGNWGELVNVLEKDVNGNVVRGDHLGVDTRDCLVFATSRMVATIGVEDLVVVETPDAVLICRRSRSQDVKGLVELLKSNGRGELL